MQTAAPTLGIEITPLQIRQGEDTAPAFEALKGRAQALYVANDPLVDTHRFASIRWRWQGNCRQCLALGNGSKRAV
jgi:ABC-type uncharacterized transport system substrate-binding protein